MILISVVVVTCMLVACSFIDYSGKRLIPIVFSRLVLTKSWLRNWDHVVFMGRY